MSALDKLAKALEALKIIHSPSPNLDEPPIPRGKEKVSLCILVADMICSPETRAAPNFTTLLSYSMETLLQICDDQDSNIRMTADECLNRIIRTVMDSNIVKVHVELHKEIKKNGSARSLRAALWRFAELAHLIRPNKGKLYIQSLVPCLMNIAKRKEESVLETLAAAIPKIFSVLGNFTTDKDIITLLRVFFGNISNENAVVRRTAATSIIGLCLNCPKTQFFLIYTLNTLLEMVLPVKIDESPYTILGVLNCIRGLLGHLNCEGKETIIRGSFGAKRKDNRQAILSADTLIQVYELCLNWTHHSDHNIVTAALETLNQLLSTPPPQFLSVLLSSQGLTRSRIQASSSAKLSNRNLSDMSVASTLPMLDESALLDSDEAISNLNQWLPEGSLNYALGTLGSNQPTIPSCAPPAVTVPEEGDTESESVGSEDADVLLKSVIIEPSPEPDVPTSSMRDSPSPPPVGLQPLQAWDIGDVVNSSQCSLVYCARRLVTAFLIPDYTSVRVSVRALAIGCLAQVLRLYPQVFTATIDLNGRSTPQGFSHVGDVLCFSYHVDQQLRGLTRSLIGYLIQAKLEQGWENVEAKGNSDKSVSLEHLVQLLLEGLGDESSVCVRHTLGSLSNCLPAILESSYHSVSKPLLEKLIILANNPYWLIKVKLAELMSTLSYQSIYYTTGGNRYQFRMIQSIILILLGDQDNRVRKSAAEGISRLVENLYFPVDYGQADIAVARATYLSRKMFADKYEEEKEQSNGPMSGLLESMTENILSRLLQILSQSLLESSSKYLTYGCIEALSLISDKYPPTTYPLGWQCCINYEINQQASASNGLLALVLALLTASPISLDLETHQWLLNLAGNLFTGLCKCVKFQHKNQRFNIENNRSQMWSSLFDTELASLAENLLQHAMRLMYIFVRILEDITHPRNVSNSPLKRRTARGTSPSKQTSALERDGFKEDKGRSFGYFFHIPHCVKIFEIVRSAYTNYRITLDSVASEKFLSLIHCVLSCLEKLLCEAGSAETGRIADEILQYLRITFILDSTTTVKVVNQLLKSLFESNFGPNRDGTNRIEGSLPTYASSAHGFYNNTIILPLQNIIYHLGTNARSQHELGKGSAKFRSTESGKVQTISYDREALAANIKLFEPIVIQALKEYTITSNVRLQVQVLRLLTQLVQLKVNYCLLDSDQIFIQFVLGQFEYLEEGQIQHAELLIPQIFKFLVHLCNEKNHSKLLISVPQVIQLCDGLMASGQNPVTHCIPALLPVVEYVFLLNSSATSDIKELETQREVLLVMLLRLAEYPQVVEILYTVMKEGWRWEEHWKRWYRRTTETVLPLLAEARLLVDNCSTLHRLLNLNMNFTTPLNNLLLRLFTPQQEGQLTVHWLGMVSTIMLSLCTYKEERILLELEQLNLYVREEGDDPLNVKTVSKTLPPQSLMAKLILRVVKTSVMTLKNRQENILENEKCGSLEKLLANFILCNIHISQPGSFEKVTNAMKDLLRHTSDLQELNLAFICISEKCPILTILWAHLLMLLDQGDRHFWGVVMNGGMCTDSKSVSLNIEVVKRGGILLYCHYLEKNPSDLESLSWFLTNFMHALVWNCHEGPIEKLLCSTYNLELNSKLLLDSLSRCVDIDEPVFTHRLLHTLEYFQCIHSNYTGAVLRLVVTSLIEHWNITLARMASAFCSRILAYLLTLDSGLVLKQLSSSQLTDLLEILTATEKKIKRHSGLVCSLYKLGSQFYGMPTYEHENGGPVNAVHIRSVKLDRTWFLSQVQDKCCGEQSNGKKCARLLSELGPDDITKVFSVPNFNINILKYCLILGTQFTLEGPLDSTTPNPLCNLVPLFKCAQSRLLKQLDHLCSTLPRPYQIYNPSCNKIARENLDQSEILFQTSAFRESFFSMVPIVQIFISSGILITKDDRQLINIISKESLDNFATFGILCIEVGHWLMLNSMKNNIKEWPSLLQHCLECSAVIFQFDIFSSLLSYQQILSVCVATFYILKVITGEETNLKNLKYSTEGKSKEYLESIESCLQIASLFSWLENHTEESLDIPSHMHHCIRSIVVSIGRIQKVNWFCRIPVEAWQIPDKIEYPPPLPVQLLHDTDILRQIVSRICMIGWTGRLQFEETWVCLLSALSPNPDLDSSDQEEISAIMQASSIAVDGITWLVLSTLALNVSSTNTSDLFHVPRQDNSSLYKLSYWKKLEAMNESLCWRLKKISSDERIELIRIDKRPNIERGNNNSGYSLGQLSVAYLQAQVTPFEERESNDNGMNAKCAEREKCLSDSGIDIRSCTQFLLDLFSQWTLPNSGISLNLQLSMVRSVLSLSDMFTEQAHFTWMLNTFIDLSKNHPQHDEVLHQYLVIGVCKATAVLKNFEGESAEKVTKVLENSLKNQFPPMRLAGIHGLLYLLQSVRTIKKSWVNVDSTQKFGIQDFRQKVLQITLDYILKYCTGDTDETSENVLLEVALVMYLLEYFYYEVPNTQAIMKFITQLVKRPVNNKCYQATMQGLEKLILSGGNDLSEQITRLALDRFSQSDPCITLPALQLLISCIYSGQHSNAVSEYNSDPGMEIMEKTSALFDRIKKGYPVEVELVCEILPRIWADFFPASDILTKVIGDFLSPNQPHRRNMAAMVFQVFTQACSEQQLPLLQDWVVHSLSNFTRNHPVVMAVWSLCCFFISASKNQWLRAIFPHVQSRIGQCDYEDRHLLCIAALDFYKQLADHQKEIFLQSFKDASSNKTPFIDVISCL